MSIKFNRSQTFATNGAVTAAGLHNLVDGLDIYQALITDQTSLAAVAPEDSILIADASLTAGDAPRQTTVQNLFDDGLSSGTYTSLNLSGALTYGTATGNRTVSTSATITTGTIPNLTAGTTTSTAATITNGTITTGLIPTLTAGTTTGTAGVFTSGTVTTLNSTTGTISNLSTTLAGDFTISQGTGTLGTTGATLGTYGGSTSVPVLAINAKGQVTSTGTAAITSGLTGFRNRIINGDMRIDQRNAGASVTPDNNVYTLDRWNFGLNQASKLTAQRSTLAPSGFTNSLLITSLSSYSVLAGDYFHLKQGIEGFNISDFAWGTSSAKTVTLSFWVRSSLTGTFSGALVNNSVNRSYVYTYSVSSANTWEYKTVTISGETSGTWATDNGIGIILTWSMGTGSTNTTSTTGSWTSSGNLSATGSTSLVGTNGATFYITGVQLEVGTTATDFERRPYGTELALCQRYYWKSFRQSVVPSDSSNDYLGAIGFNHINGNIGQGMCYFPSTMRAAPTITLFNPRPSGASGQATDTTSDDSSTRATLLSDRSFAVDNTSTNNSNSNRVYVHAVASAEL